MITLEQIKSDIVSGKCKHIFFSSQTRWWTHDVDDVKQATVAGKIKADEKMNALLENPAIQYSHQQKLKSLKASADNAKGILLDPTGAPLYQMGDPTEWILKAETHPELFGEYGIDALLFAHHQNCMMVITNKWDLYNKAIALKNAF